MRHRPGIYNSLEPTLLPCPFCGGRRASRAVRGLRGPADRKLFATDGSAALEHAQAVGCLVETIDLLNGERE